MMEAIGWVLPTLVLFLVNLIALSYANQLP